MLTTDYKITIKRERKADTDTFFYVEIKNGLLTTAFAEPIKNYGEALRKVLNRIKEEIIN